MQQTIPLLKNNFLKLTLICVGFSLLLISCNHQSTLNAEKTNFVTITFGANKIFQKQYEALIDDFESQSTGISVQFMPFDEEIGSSALDYSHLASLSDTMILPAQPFGSDAYNYLDLTEVIANDPTFGIDQIWANSLDGCRADGRLIGIPLSIQTLLVMYNGAVFDEIGLEHPTPGWSWEDFQEAAQALTKRSGGEVTRYGFVDYNHPTSLLAPLIDAVNRQNGNEYDPVKLTNALDWYVSLAQNGHIPSDYSAEEAGEVRNYISTSQAAMWVDALSSLEERRNELGESIAVAPFPQGGINGNQKTTQAWATCGLVSAGTAHPQEAVTWLQFLAEQEIPGVSPNSIPAVKAATKESGFWNKLDVNTAAAVRYALEHGWYGAASNLPFEQIGQAVNDAKTGSDKLVDTLAMIPIDIVRLTPENTPFAVATPGKTTAPMAYSSDQQVVRYFFYFSYQKDLQMLKTFAETFMDAHPKIVIELVEFQDTDLPYINFEQLAENFDCFAESVKVDSYEASQLYNLQPLIDTDMEGASLLNDIPESEWNLNRLNGDIYALPVASKIPVMYYNEDIFAAKGLPPPALNWTLEDFWTSASAASSEEIYGFVPEDGSFFVNYLLSTQGVKLYDLTSKEPQVYFNDPVVLSTVSLLAEMAKNGVIPPIRDAIDRKKSNIDQRYDALMAGKAAMWIDPAGLSNSELFIPADAKFSVVPLPSTNMQFTFMNYGVSLYISQRAQEPRACWEWIKFLSNKPEVFIGIPVRRSVLNSIHFEAYYGSEKAAAYRVAIEEPRFEFALGTNEIYPSVPFYFWWQDTLTSVFDGTPAAQALSEVQGKAERYLKCIETKNEPQNKEVWMGCALQVDPEFKSLLN
jgi:ABC-type glycerol-3-phosphate transport system substrate-binding protein